MDVKNIDKLDKLINIITVLTFGNVMVSHVSWTNRWINVESMILKEIENT